MTDASSLEKGDLVQTIPSATPTSASVAPPFDRAAERRLLRKLDFRIIPVLWILALVNFIDRANIGNAKVQGMEKDLHLVDQRYNMCIWVFNLGYLVAGIPLQLVFKRYGPKSLCVMIFCWGFTVIGCGLVRRWEQLVVCRLLEGIAESAFTAGALYLIGAYYTDAEYLTRYVFIFVATVLAGAVNGFLSSLIAKMDGVAGYGGWRWIFIIEGCITILVSSASWPIMPPFPEKCDFLSMEEKALMLARVAADGGGEPDEAITFKRVLLYLRDWKTITSVLMYLAALESANSLANFLPTILRGLNYTATGAQVHSIPIYIVGATTTIILGYLSDRLKSRYPFYMLGCSILITGLAIELAYPPSVKVRYMAVFFIACGAYLAMPVASTWAAINAGRGNKRAVVIAATVNFGTAGAFISSNVFKYSETPRFHTGFSSNIGLACMGATAATITWLGCRRERDSKASITAQEHETKSDLEQSESI